MKILSKITTSDQVLRQFLENLNLSYEQSATNDRTAHFEPVSECSPDWPGIAEAVRDAKERGGYVGISCDTVFDKQDRDEAHWFILSPTWYAGFPAYRGYDFSAFFEVTLDSKNECRACGWDKVQVANIMLKAEPRWRSRSMLALFWLEGECFVRREVFETVFAKFGATSRPVLRFKTGRPLETIVQLDSSNRADLDLGAGTICPVCGHAKHPWNCRGFMAAPISGEAPDVFRSNQMFGSGGASNSGIFVSQAVFREAQRYGLDPRNFWPCALPAT